MAPFPPRRRTRGSEAPPDSSLAASSSPALRPSPPSSFLTEIVKATRPWSLPASLMPACLAVAAASRSHPVAFISDALPAVLAAASVHLGANLLNTWADYSSGLDTQATADDRALVDARVTPRAVLQLAIALLALGAGLCMRVVFTLGPAAANIAWVPITALVLAVAYSAGPRALKHIALGDVTIALCFGPLLMAGVAMAATRTAAVDAAVLAFSLPMALQTVCILHANNARDAVADRAAGCVTVAGLIGGHASAGLYAALLAFAYAGAARAVCVAHEGGAYALFTSVACALSRVTPQSAAGELTAACAAMSPDAYDAARSVALGVVLLAATLPTARGLVGTFFAGIKKRALLRALPQATAEFGGSFGGALLASLLIPVLLSGY